MAPIRRLNRGLLRLRSSMLIQALLAFSMIVPLVFILWLYNTQIVYLQKTQVIELPASTYSSTGNDGVVYKRIEKKRSPKDDNDGTKQKVAKITAWEIKSADHDYVDENAAKVKPATVCACAKCGVTSLYRELFAIVHGRSYDSINYQGPGFIHGLSNKKLWTSIQAEKKTDWSNFQNEDSFALIRDPKARLLSAWRDKVSCRIVKENPTRRRFVPKLLKLSGSSNVTAKESKGYPCLDLSDYLSVLFQIHAQGKEGLLDSHFLPQTLGCFNNAPPSMWSHITTISDPNTLCLLKSIVLENTNTTQMGSNCQKMMRMNKKRNDIKDLNPIDEEILDKITFKEYKLLGEYLTKSPTSTYPQELLTALQSQGDICNLAHNLYVESEHYSSYQLGLNWSNVDHVAKKLCLRWKSPKESAENQTTIHDSPTPISNDASLILTFKVARSGSTFFTDVIIKALSTMKRAANLHWEPYCRAGCYNRKSPIEMENELSIISSSNCSTNTIDPPSCSIPGTHKKCCPVKKCHSPEFHPNAISVVSLNPRFSDSVRWDKILSPSFPRTSSAKVFNLRRTNLVNLAYSKYHHDGCPVINEGLNGDECIPEKTNSTSFSFNCLLQCVQHYGEFFVVHSLFLSFIQTNVT